MQQQQQQQQQKQDKGDGLGLGYSATCIFAMPVLLLLRSGFGWNALGWPAFLCMIGMVLSVPFFQAPEMFLYLLVWFAFLVYRRIETFRLLGKGRILHSRYQGYPWLAMKFPFVRREKTALMLIEPLV